VVTAGIFYAFYGFGMIAVYGAELKNPKRNIPIALVVSVVLCFNYLFIVANRFYWGLTV
jgi:amino acid transporter